MTTPQPKGAAALQPLTWLLKQLHSALRASVDESLAALGLTMAEASVLAELSLAPRRSNAELARAAFVTPQSMVALLKALEARGLILRRQQPGQGRAMPAELTDEGARQLMSFHLAMRQAELRMLGSLPPADQKHLRALLERCLSSLREG